MIRLFLTNLSKSSIEIIKAAGKFELSIFYSLLLVRLKKVAVYKPQPVTAEENGFKTGITNQN